MSESMSSAQLLDLRQFSLQPGTTLIEASAGTGKTFTIQYCVLDLILKGVELQQILVLTFTESATQELRARIQQFLLQVYQALQLDRPLAEPLHSVLTRARAQQSAPDLMHKLAQAIQQIDEAPIQTIHAFCQRSLQEHTFLAQSDFERELVTDLAPISERLVGDFLRRANHVFQLPFPKGGERPQLLLRADQLSCFTQTALTQVHSIESLQAPLISYLQQFRSYAAEQTEILQEFLSFEGQLNARRYSTQFFAEFPALLQRCLSAPETVGLQLYKKLGAQQLTEAFNKAYKSQGKRPEHPFFSLCTQFVQAHECYSEQFFHCFDHHYIAALKQYKLEQGLLSFDDMVGELARALQGHSGLLTVLQKRYQAGLVDEFQDTDARQYAIFEAIFGAHRSADLGAAYFAMIGDPKQSIYAFRGADIRCYFRAKTAVQQAYTLGSNYRSDPRLVAACNDFFHACDLGGDGVDDGESIPFQAVAAQDAAAMKTRLVFADARERERLFVQSIDAEGCKVEAYIDRSMEQTAAMIAQLLNVSAAGKIAIEQLDAHGAVSARRPVQASDLAVLVDRNREAELCQAALRKQGIHAVQNKRASVYTSEEARHFLYFLRACQQAKPRWLHALLVSPLYGKTANDLKAMSPSEHHHLQQAFVDRGRSWRQGQSLGQLWDAFLQSIAAPTRLLLRQQGERMLTNYQHVGELASELAATKALSPAALIEQWARRIQQALAGETAQDDAALLRLESDRKAVQLVTLHSSKGLEYPVVFLPTLWQKCVQVKRGQSAQPIPDPQNLDRLLQWQPWNAEQQARTKSEVLRLGYVGLTRAVHQVFYLTAPQFEQPKNKQSSHFEGWFDRWVGEQRGQSAARALSVDDYFSGLAAAPALDCELVAASTSPAPRRFERGPLDQYGILSYTRFTHQDTSARRGEPLAFRVEPALTRRELIEAPADRENLMLRALPSGAAAGTCVHTILENCDLAQPNTWTDLIRTQLQQHFPDGASHQVSRERAIRQLLHGLRDPELTNGMALAQLSPQSCRREFSFYCALDGVDAERLHQVLSDWLQSESLPTTPYLSAAHPTLRGFLTGSIDLLFEHAGQYFILDWKTNRPLPHQAECCASYDLSGMQAQMLKGGYYLQALIYSAALDYYLRLSLGAEFEWERHMGGFIYCFVRGLSPATGWLQQRFPETLVQQAQQALGMQLGKDGNGY